MRFVALIEILRDKERLLETNFDFGSIFKKSRNHKPSWQFPQLYYLFSLTSRETETLNLISQNGRENSFWSSWNRFNNFFQRAYKTWLPGRISGIRTSCQLWFPWAGQTECTNSLLPLMVLQVPNLGPWKKKSKCLRKRVVKPVHNGKTGSRLNRQLWTNTILRNLQWQKQRGVQIDVRSELKILTVVYREDIARGSTTFHNKNRLSFQSNIALHN